MIVVDINVMVMALAGPTDRGETARSALFTDDHNAFIYDAAYLAAAALHDAPVITFDARLAKGAQQAMPEIEVIVL